ncbi:MAG: hypothetical protein A3I88_00185 [Candidatus Portnoybacteria bacterium RIFCSPLOWO2_12_FULL_39_9]|uniref:Uncharacterized protein n=1 Tax=Candidatus Portnoybacteria bacterium RIFCSPHIGHO2_12_FULL_38_9 TaxID=1801997 RepID=A0A1G2FIK2_9BACT|nr:MAG: hypothetical protein A3H00_01810 [Candidatus Portnoybacteria bacterium RBG_13_40_8]OGZ36483.1 MAG: hypothetical protein A2646_01440 [Candidatus Portnoybacteria bacterium RIFCSPHIGHO2_02_FULL_39_12]OGZ37408.1 MAG: hypothetical protein A3J64_01705 [Candidatus Portnoybacteria bacterium RIFCSPHIGHO2_12_FULL_38_9]OGZ39282.1 MAG: hypothetical protein A3F21_01710 [Candidatus Portnoybacteria bacterium RIFCSPLOWO2_01_FULL_38_39]OGZ41144.1 MAG: hypothetical protein A3I88_00185 [Candidatus Portnoy
MRDKIDISPNMTATKSRSKIPIKPQFKPPITSRIKVIQSKVFNLFIFFKLFKFIRSPKQTPTFLIDLFQRHRPLFSSIVFYKTKFAHTSPVDSV